MAFEIDISHFKKFLEIQEERQRAMLEVSQTLGIDITMSEEEKIKYAEQDFAKYLEEAIYKEVAAWMKSAL